MHIYIIYIYIYMYNIYTYILYIYIYTLILFKMVGRRVKRPPTCFSPELAPKTF